jgi:histidinol-phosphate aminotransferase
MELAPWLDSLRAYVPGKPISTLQRELGINDIIKLASNENPLGPSPAAIEATTRYLRQGSLYPDGGCIELRSKLAQHRDVKPEQIMVGAGSDELIQFISNLFLYEHQFEAISGTYTFPRYKFATGITGAKYIEVPNRADFRYDLDAMTKAITPNTRLIWIANPNNPTGEIVPTDELEPWLRSLPKHVTVVLDHAYQEYAEGEAGYPDALKYFHEGLNVICLYTFSKAYGMAGWRVGYGVASNHLVSYADRMRPAFNVNSLAQEAAIAALEDQDFITLTTRTNKTNGKLLREAIIRAGGDPIPTYGNFITADFHTDSGPLVQAIEREGIIVRGGAGLGMPTFLRISIGLESEIARLDQALQKVRPAAHA